MENKARILIFSIPFKMVLNLKTMVRRQVKERKSMKSSKKEVKLFPFAKDMIVHNKNSKEFTKVLQ